MTLREEHRSLTRAKIIGAVLDLVAETKMGDLNVPLVARRSGVSVASIYRYFPTKDAMLDAAAEEPARRAGQALPDDSVTDEVEYLRTMWEAFADNLPLIRRQVASPAGRDLRDRRYRASREWVRERIARRGIPVDSAPGERLVTLAMVLTSSLAFVDLHDRQGQSPGQAVDAVAWALDALTAATRRDLRRAGG